LSLKYHFYALLLARYQLILPATMRPFFSVCLFPYSKNTKKVRIIFIFVKTNSYKMRKIEHIGIAVKNLETSNTLFEKLLGVPAYKVKEVASVGMKTSLFMNVDKTTVSLGVS